MSLSEHIVRDKVVETLRLQHVVTHTLSVCAAALTIKVVSSTSHTPSEITTLQRRAHDIHVSGSVGVGMYEVAAATYADSRFVPPVRCSTYRHVV